MPNNPTTFTDDDGESVTVMFYEGGEFQELFHGSVDELSDRVGQQIATDRLGSQPESKLVVSGRDRQSSNR